MTRPVDGRVPEVGDAPIHSRPTGGPQGLLVVDKPAGWTSHQVVARVRGLLGTRKVGHAGTLDPLATGVLVIGVGRATRLLGRLALADKAYDATIRLGQATITDDREGEITMAPGAAGLTDAAIEHALSGLRGSIRQIPSAVSAIKVGGVRSYARVRSGEQVELVARPVTVTRFQVLARRDEIADATPVVDLDVCVECGTGTYVRALARDLGAAVGSGGHLTALRRTRVGPFTLTEAQPLDDPALAVTPIAEAVRRCFIGLDLTAEQATAVRHGRRLPGTALPADPTALFDPQGAFLALYRPAGDDAVPEAVFVG